MALTGMLPLGRGTVAIADEAVDACGRVDVRNRVGPPVRSDQLIACDFLALVRFGLRSPHDRRVTDTVALIDELLAVQLPTGVAYRRYNGDGYGEHDDGSPFNGTGTGRPWPLLAGERGHYAAQAGQDADRYLDSMAAMTGRGQLLPEQVWDGEPVPERFLEPGHPTGSAMPLAWAHAEFATVVDQLGQGGARPDWHWRADLPFSAMPPGRDLMVDHPVPFTLRSGERKRRAPRSGWAATAFWSRTGRLPRASFWSAVTMRFWPPAGFRDHRRDGKPEHRRAANALGTAHSPRLCCQHGRTPPRLEFDRSVSDQSTAGGNQSLSAMVDAGVEILGLIGHGAPIDSILDKLCALFEAQLDGSMVSILLVNDDGTALTAARAPSLDPQYQEAIHPMEIADNVGSCGTAAWHRRPVMVEDIATDPRWQTTREHALAAGLRSCWSVPIIGSDGELLGTFAAYWTEPTTPTAANIALQQQFANLTQIAVERHLSERRLARRIADERRRIAEDLHDDPIQAVTAVSLQLQRLARTGSTEQLELIHKIQASIDGAIVRMRRMLFELHPPALDDDGLCAAIELYLSEIFDPTDVAWNLSESMPTEPTAVVGSLAYRLTREALWNAAKHAEATRIDVDVAQKDGWLTVRITDNGVGFEPNHRTRSREKHLGLEGSRDVAHRASGQWSVISAPGAGTTVEFSLPDSKIGLH